MPERSSSISRALIITFVYTLNIVGSLNLKIIQISLLILASTICIAQPDPFFYRTIKKDTLPVLLEEQVVDDHLRSKIFSRSGQHLLTLDTYKDSIRIRYKDDLIQFPEGFDIDSVCSMPFVDPSTDSLYIPVDLRCRLTFGLKTDSYTVVLRKDINDLLMMHSWEPRSVDHERHSALYSLEDRPPDLYGGVTLIGIDRPEIMETFYYEIGELNGYSWIKPLTESYSCSVDFVENDVSVIEIWEKHDLEFDKGLVYRKEGNSMPLNFFPEAFNYSDTLGLMLLKVRYIVGSEDGGSLSYYHKGRVIAVVYLDPEDKFKDLMFIEK